MNGDLLKVDSNVVMPKSGWRPQNKYPWMQLNPVCGVPPRGDSFLVECYIPSEVERAWNSLTSCKYSISHKTGRKFVMRRVPGGIRVWRIR